MVMLLVASVTTKGLAQEEHDEGAAHEASSDEFRIATHRTWFYRSFLPNADDDADTLGLEFISTWGWGNYDVTNISYIELADYEAPIPGYPIGNPEPGTVPDTGINDLLSGFIFSKKGAHHGPYHFGYGIATQLPTGSGKTLSSGKYSLGPIVDFEYTNDRLFMAVVALQIWSVAGDSDRKDVNMLMMKPVVVYDLSEKWQAVYMPYGVSIYWNKPSGQSIYLPIGGGIQRKFNLGARPSAASLQVFKNVLRPDDGVKYDLRFMLEINF